MAVTILFGWILTFVSSTLLLVIAPLAFIVFAILCFFINASRYLLFLAPLAFIVSFILWLVF